MHGIYNYVPETNYVTRIYSVTAAVMYLQFVLRVMLLAMLNMFVLLHSHFLQYVCSDQYDCFL